MILIAQTLYLVLSEQLLSQASLTTPKPPKKLVWNVSTCSDNTESVDLAVFELLNI